MLHEDVLVVSTKSSSQHGPKNNMQAQHKGGVAQQRHKSLETTQIGNIDAHSCDRQLTGCSCRRWHGCGKRSEIDRTVAAGVDRAGVAQDDRSSLGVWQSPPGGEPLGTANTASMCMTYNSARSKSCALTSRPAKPMMPQCVYASMRALSSSCHT